VELLRGQRELVPNLEPLVHVSLPERAVGHGRTCCQW
jgi:hypothetical protein